MRMEYCEPLPEYQGILNQYSLISHPTRGGIRQVRKKRFEISIAFDNEFCALYWTDYHTAVAALRTACVAANTPFARRTIICLTVISMYGHCNHPQDPYANLKKLRSTKGFDVLLDIENFWRVNQDIYMEGRCRCSLVSSLVASGD